MKLKCDYPDNTISIKRFGKVFCRRPGEHLGWILFKLPFERNHHNSGYKGKFKKVVVLLRNMKIIAIEEYQVNPIDLAKKNAFNYLMYQEVPDRTDKIQYEAHIRNVISDLKTLIF